MNLAEALLIMKMTSVTSHKELKSSYRKQAKEAHPDLNGSKEKFKSLQDAYSFLLNHLENKASKKKSYVPDQINQKDLTHFMTIGLSFEEACTGTLKRIAFEKMSMQTRSGKCELCWGRGKIKKSLGKLIQCNVCGTKPVLSRSTKTIRIPAGIENNQKLVFESEGHCLDNIAGSLVISVRVKPDEKRSRKGCDIIEDVPVTYSDLLLGKKIIAKTLHGDQRVTIPFGSFDGDVLRLKGKGIDQKKNVGDHLISLKLISPTRLTDEQKLALEELRRVGL